MKRYETFDHVADVGIVAYGRDLAEAFANVALGMFQQITDLERIEEARSWDVKSEAEDLESLVVRWLNDLLFLFDTEQIVPCRIEVTSVEPTGLRATLWGEKLSPGRHEVKSEVKAATLHQVQVTRGKQPRVQVILDL